MKTVEKVRKQQSRKSLLLFLGVVILNIGAVHNYSTAMELHQEKMELLNQQSIIDGYMEQMGLNPVTVMEDEQS